MRLSQNLPNFLDAYGRAGRHKVDTLLGNHATKISHRNRDPVTNEWASKVIAKETTYKHSISTTGSINQPIGLNSQTSVNEVEEDSCPPKEFIGLAGSRSSPCANLSAKWRMRCSNSPRRIRMIDCRTLTPKRGRRVSSGGRLRRAGLECRKNSTVRRIPDQES